MVFLSSFVNTIRCASNFPFHFVVQSLFASGFTMPISREYIAWWNISFSMFLFVSFTVLVELPLSLLPLPRVVLTFLV